MSNSGSVTRWVNEIRNGDEQAAQQLWERYYQKLVTFARNQIRNAPRAMADEEDAALKAFDSFYRDAQAGRIPAIADRHDLWKLLIRMTAQKSLDQIRLERAKKRGGHSLAVAKQLDEIVGNEPTPEFSCQVAEECRRLLALLPDEEMRAIAVWKMEGFTNEEISAKIDRVPRTVERSLKLIRSIWLRNTDD